MPDAQTSTKVLICSTCSGTGLRSRGLPGAHLHPKCPDCKGRGAFPTLFSTITPIDPTTAYHLVRSIPLEYDNTKPIPSNRTSTKPKGR
jgi:hypothetical protein